MGVRGLLSYMIREKERCSDIVDLVEEAKNKNGIEILCDYYCLQQFLLTQFWKTLSCVSNNPYLKFLGGEYDSLNTYISTFASNMEALNIHLILFIDSAKGSSKITLNMKLNTWKSRHSQDIQKIKDMLKVVNGFQRPSFIADDNNSRPVLNEIQMLHAFKSQGCEIIECLEGEADFKIAKALNDRPKAYTILSNDSDFCIFKNCHFIPFSLFDIDANIGLGKSHFLPKKPFKLKCGILSSNKLSTLLQFEHSSQLIELSILAGNDYTTSFIDASLIESIGYKGKVNFHGLVKWIKENKSVSNHPVLQSKIKSSSIFSYAVDKSRQYYSLTLNHQEDIKASPLRDFLIEKINSGLYSRTLLAMYNNFYWLRMMIQILQSGFPIVERELAELRCYLYQMIHDDSELKVLEHGQTSMMDFQVIEVGRKQVNWLPNVMQIKQDEINVNMQIFDRIMSHLEENNNNRCHFFQKYNVRNGFICYILRYFLLHNMKNNLFITKEEFHALFASVFSKVDINHYQNFNILSDARCVTIGNWLQDIYRHAYSFIGGILFLNNNFPLPKDLFSGAVWSAFYMSTLSQHKLQKLRFPPQLFRQIDKDINKVLNANEESLLDITNNIDDKDIYIDRNFIKL